MSSNKMSIDHFQFLKNKFIEHLEDMEEEYTEKNEIPLALIFCMLEINCIRAIFTLIYP